MIWVNIDEDDLKEIEIVQCLGTGYPEYVVMWQGRTIAMLPTITDAKNYLVDKLPFRVEFYAAIELDATGNAYWTMEKA